MLAISKNKIVFLDMTLLDDQGKTIETTDGRETFSYIHGRGNLLLALEFELEGQCAGFECEVPLEPTQAFGDYYPDLLIEVSKKQLSSDIKMEVGEYIQANGPNGVMEFKIESMNQTHVTLNANHPFAGKKLTFFLNVLDVREPHRDELRHRRPHPAGHHLMVTGSSLR